MANVRCPMCSKINPTEAEECAYCRARLKPVRPSSSGQPEKAGDEQPPAGNGPDWLMGLRAEAPDDPQEELSEAAEQAADADLPDWLSRIRSDSDTDNAVSSLDQEADDLPDWMRGLQDGAPSDAGKGSSLFDRLQDDQARQDLPQKDAGQQPDWLSDLGSGDAPAAGEEEDWMSKLSSWQANPVEEDKSSVEAEPSPSASSPAGNDDISWLSGINLEDDTAEDPATQGLGLTDFLSGKDVARFLAGNEPAAGETPPQEEKTISSGFGITDFLSNMEQAAENPADDLSFLDSNLDSSGESALPEWTSESQTPAPQVSGDELPDWLGGLQSDQPDQPQSAAPSSQSGIPDWLSGSAPLDSQPSPASPEDAAIPSWLSGNFAPEEPKQSQAPQEPGGLPGWLSGFEDSTPADNADLPQPSQQNEGLPNWLSAADDQNAPPEAAVEPALGAQTDLPDWLSALNAEDKPAAGHEEVTEPESAQDWISDFGGAEEEPAGILSNDQQPIEEISPLEETPAVEKAPFIDDETPDWLREFNAGADSPEEVVSPLLGLDDQMVSAGEADTDQSFSVDLPDWLSEETAPKLDQEAEQAAEATGDELAQADLPEWVREMRPIESAIVSDSLVPEMDQRVEKAGPLAGMRGVLPAEEMLAHYRKPPVYSVKLRVTDKQRSQAALLESIVSQEPQPLLIAPDRVHSTRIIPRILVAVLLLVVLIIPRLLEIDPLGVPVLYPAEMLEMFESLNQTQQETSVILLAVDYEPGRAGEMQFTASPVIEHLMAQNVNIAIISTVPNGPALAQRLISTAATSHQEQTDEAYNQGERVVNLGYLPGGAISLLEFAQFPRRSAPADLTGDYAVWQNTFLQEVNSLGDFAQIIVLTDSAETGRAWVEQVQPMMGSAPLFMITSAQASPLLVPYLESGQISGLVSGLLGGAMYARLLAQGSGPAAVYLATYQVGLLLAFVLILAGGLVSGGMALFKRNEKDEA
jgi:hypothetical protein